MSDRPMPSRPMSGRIPLVGMALWSLLLLLESTAQISLKLGGRTVQALPVGLDWLVTALHSPWVWLGAGCYMGSFLAWMLILRRTQLSLAFPVSAAIYIVTVPASWLLLGEQISLARILGALLIAAGVAVMGFEWPRTD